MAFKIYTYVDPYRIGEADFWNDIKSYPHLCASRTMVNGLINVMGEEIEALLCPIDDVVNKRVYNKWAEDISHRIGQYIKLGTLLETLYKDGYDGLNDARYDAVKNNKSKLLDAIRLFIELGIKAKSLKYDDLDFEHRLFIELLKQLENDDDFIIEDVPQNGQNVSDITSFRDIFCEQANYEMSEKVKRHSQRTNDVHVVNSVKSLYDKMVYSANNWDCKHVVIHGIHQFTPLQLRFISTLHNLGVEIVFVYNYIPKYKEIYSSWDYIYQFFNATLSRDEVVREYHDERNFYTVGNAIAKNMALLCKDKKSFSDIEINNNYHLYKDTIITEFDNVSEYAGYVSTLITNAEAKYAADNEGKDRRKNTLGTAQILRLMEDVIYTANKDVDDLLQIYHPDYARTRHFLAYPVGKFFVALYRLWDEEKKEIRIDFNLLKDCVYSGMMVEFDSERMLKTLLNLEPLFLNLNSLTDFKERFEDFLCSREDLANGVDVFGLKAVNLYNNDEVSMQDVAKLVEVVMFLNDTAATIFGDIEKNKRFNFGQHFARLQEFICSRQDRLVNEEEKELIEKLLEKINIVRNGFDSADKKGTFEDLKQGIDYFMKQKEENRFNSNWFVKNFEQIDGDILSNKVDRNSDNHKVAHFACVSDKDLNCKVNDLLPWPLTNNFIEKAYNPKDMIFQVYYAALGERSNFLRYELFYGLFFSKCDVKISFVKNYGEDSTNFYNLLRLIGLESDRNYHISMDENDSNAEYSAEGAETRWDFNRCHMGAMFLCPYKYLLEYVIKERPVITGEFLIRRFCVNLLVDVVWKKLSNFNLRIAKMQLITELNNTASELKEYFPFYRESEVMDIVKQAENYIRASSSIFEGMYNYNSNHMELRRTFGAAMFSEKIDNAPKPHPYTYFEQMTTGDAQNKKYSIHAIKNQDGSATIMKNCTLDYINRHLEKMERPGPWCSYCTEQELCLARFAEEIAEES